MEQSKPVFVYSIGWDWLFWAAWIVFLVTAAAYILYLTPQNPGVPVFFIILSLLLLTTVWRSAAPRVRRAAFYDSEAKLTGRGIQTEFEYSRIKSVSIKKSILFGPRTEILLADQTKPYVLIRNPKSAALGVDLYSWLMQKVSKPNPGSQ